METTGTWKAVTLSSATPQLLMKIRLDRTGYQLQLTDLSRIWEETLPKQDIIQRAIERGCAFNPGEDDGNYETFLKCIKSALSGEARTTSTLRAGESAKLLLDLSTPLPGQLSDFLWTIEFEQLPEAAVASEIVGPLLLQANRLQSQIQQLVDEISSKDHVIQKITDSLAVAGSDLTVIFPGVSNVKTSKKRTQSQRSQFAGHVKGLADFDEVAWKAAHEKLCEGQELTPDVMNSVLRDLPPRGNDGRPIESWIQTLSSKKGAFRRLFQVPSRTKSLSGHTEAPEEDTQDEDFQRQDTPPHLSKPSESGKAMTGCGSTTRSAQPAQPAPNRQDSETETEDEDCLDIPPTTSQQLAVGTIEPAGHPEEEHDQNVTQPRSRSGDPGKLQSPQPDLNEETNGPDSSPPITKSQVKLEAYDTESEAEPENVKRKGGLGKFGGAKPKNDPPPANSEGEAEQPPTAKPKGTLGKFGGKKAQPSVSTPEPVTSTSKPRSTLGRFGGKSKEVSMNRSTEGENEDGGRDPSSESESAKRKTALSRRLESHSEQPPERELTEEEKQQRADGKREKLKRELEERAKGPAKKKRKF